MPRSSIRAAIVVAGLSLIFVLPASADPGDAAPAAASGPAPGGPSAAAGMEPQAPGSRFIFMYAPNDVSLGSRAGTLFASISQQARAEPSRTLTIRGYVAAGESADLATQRVADVRHSLEKDYGIDPARIIVASATAPDPDCKQHGCITLLLQSPDDVASVLPVDTLQQRADDGDPAAQYALAMRCFSGKGVAKDARQGMVLLRKALDHADAAAIATLVGVINKDTPPPFAWQDVEHYLQQAAGQGNPDALFGLGELYELNKYPGISMDRLKAAQDYQAAADKGRPVAGFDLAAMYIGTAHDYATAASWFRRDADNGSWLGAEALSLMYANGRGVALDPVQAASWRARTTALLRGQPAPATDVAVISSILSLSAPAGPNTPPGTAPTAVEDESTLGGGAAASSFAPPPSMPSIGVCNLAYRASGRSVCDAPK